MFGKLTKAIEGLTRALCERHNDDVLRQINERLDHIMATQAELTNDLKAVLAQQQKTATEIAAVQAGQDVLTTKIAELEAVIAAGGTIGQELIDAVAAVKAQSQINDDLIPDAPAPTP